MSSTEVSSGVQGTRVPSGKGPGSADPVLGLPVTHTFHG